MAMRGKNAGKGTRKERRNEGNGEKKEEEMAVKRDRRRKRTF